jgi:hypothetical protein
MAVGINQHREAVLYLKQVKVQQQLLINTIQDRVLGTNISNGDVLAHVDCTQHAILHTRYLYLLPIDRVSHLCAALPPPTCLMRACHSAGSSNLSWHIIWRCLDRDTQTRPSSSQTCDAILSSHG